MSSYYCSPRALWFDFGPTSPGWSRYPNPLCTCLCSPLISCRVHPPGGDATNGGDFVTTDPDRDAEVERVARRAAEIVLEKLRGAGR